eukprot:scaffold83869_cov45-Cyclotella_meneghiniana.AAC.3
MLPKTGYLGHQGAPGCDQLGHQTDLHSEKTVRSHYHSCLDRGVLAPSKSHQTRLGVMLARGCTFRRHFILCTLGRQFIVLMASRDESQRSGEVADKLSSKCANDEDNFSVAPCWAMMHARAELFVVSREAVLKSQNDCIRNHISLGD